MRVIAPIPKQFEDSNGVPYANGKVTVYLHNSTSLAQIYQEAEGGTLAPNPTILDSHGAWNAFVNGDTAYDYVVQDEHDNVIFSYSNVKANVGGGSTPPVTVSAPLVGVELKSSGATKRFGDDGFVKNNPSDGKPSLYLPESGWWLFNVRLGLRNVTPRDLVQNITLEWNWNGFIADGVPPVTYTAQYPPSMQTEVDFTSAFTQQYGASAFVDKDNYTNRWLTVCPIVYGGAPLTDTEWAVVIDIFKVRDA